MESTLKDRVTLQDVADKAGLARSTVSRALRGDRRVSAATREELQELAKKMGYQRDPLLSAFASRRRGKVAGSEITTIAYVTNFPRPLMWQDNQIYMRYYQGAVECARQHGYKVEHFWLKERGMTGRRLSQILYSRGIQAVCLPPSPTIGHISLDWSRFTTIAIGFSILRPKLHRVTHHHYGNMELVLRELRRLGYRRIGLGCFAGTSKRTNDQWLAGMLVFQEYHPDMVLRSFLFTDETLPRIPDWCREWKLEVLIGTDPVIFPQLVRAGIAIPGELKFVTISWPAWEGPDIAGTDQQPEALGAAAVDLLVSQLQRGDYGVPRIPITTLVEGRWVPGRSLGRARRS